MSNVISKSEVKDCYNFAETAWNYQSQKHFGGKARTKEEFIADQTEGKLAELIFMKFLEKKGMKINLDFNHYEGELNTDEGDFKFPLRDKLIEARVDVKGSSNYAQWLLVEDYKFIDPISGEYKSNAFVRVCFGKTFPGNKELRKNPKIILDKEYEGEVRGWALVKDFYEPNGGDFWFEWKKGDSPWHSRVLPPTISWTRKALDNYLVKSLSKQRDLGLSTTISINLQAKMNYGLPIKWLRTDWIEFISFIKSKST